MASGRAAAAEAAYMRIAIAAARQSPPKPTNFCVGACLVVEPESAAEREAAEPVEGGGNDDSDATTVAVAPPLETGFTLECEGNTHAEQSCFLKLAARYGCAEHEVGLHLPAARRVTLYTTMEPCNQRSVGNMPCVDRILRLCRADGRRAIDRVCIGVAEPETFVGVNAGRRKLEDAGVEVVHVPGFEEEILGIATAGHEKGEQGA